MGLSYAQRSTRPFGAAAPEEQREGDSMLQEFRAFAMRGNVIDLAIGVIIGVAFGRIVDSLVNDIIMPIIGSMTGGLDFSNYFVGLSHNVTAANLVDAKKQGAVFAFGNFLTVVVNFIIIAFVLFLVVTLFMQPPPPAAAPAPTKSEVLLTEIRDALVKR
jgi:large conductance mechanosensitive channel